MPIALQHLDAKSVMIYRNNDIYSEATDCNYKCIGLFDENITPLVRRMT